MAIAGRVDVYTGNANIDGILSSSAWYITHLTYGFPTEASFYGTAEEYGDNAGYPTKGFAPVQPGMMQTFRAILEGTPPIDVGPEMQLLPVSGIVGMTFQEVDVAQNPIIAVAKTNATNTAVGYYPSDSTPSAGDIWIGTKYAGFDTPYLGKYYYFTTMHELGHALGLKHGHEARSSTEVALPAETDSVEYSVMTYRSYVGAEITGSYLTDPYSFPQTFMMNDIAALQVMYGANFSFRNGDTTYSWSPTTGESFVDGEAQGQPGDSKDPARSNKIFQTIWDGGGTDTYDLSNYEADLTIDLRPGGHSSFDPAQIAHLDYRNTDHPARGNVFNALLYNDDMRSLIENAIGGTGDDTITGNSAANRLSGGAGQDILHGGANDDILDGGAGADMMYGGLDDDTYIVDNIDDVIINEGGSDTVITAVSYVLHADWLIDELRASGSGNIDLTGNAGDNVIVGNSGANVIDGGRGQDVIDGGAGTDTVVFNAKRADHTVTKLSGNAFSVLATVSLGGEAIVSNVELFRFADGTLASTDLIPPASVPDVSAPVPAPANPSGPSVLRGTSRKDVLKGTAGNDQLWGGLGNDVLTGGKGRDIFVFDKAPNKKTNFDKITDFNVKDDPIWLDNAVFKKLGKGSEAKPGKLNKKFFTLSDKAKDKDDYLFYDAKKGRLFYDADGSGKGKAVEIASLSTKLKLTVADFGVI